MRRLRISDNPNRPGHNCIELVAIGRSGIGERRGAESITYAQAIARGLIPAEPVPEITITSPTALSTALPDAEVTMSATIVPPPGKTVESINWYLCDPDSLKAYAGNDVSAYYPPDLIPSGTARVRVVVKLIGSATLHEVYVDVPVGTGFNQSFCPLPKDWPHVGGILDFDLIGVPGDAPFVIPGTPYQEGPGMSYVGPFAEALRLNIGTPAVVSRFLPFGSTNYASQNLYAAKSDGSMVVFCRGIDNPTMFLGRTYHEFTYSGGSWAQTDVQAPLPDNRTFSWFAASSDLNFYVFAEWDAGSNLWNLWFMARGSGAFIAHQMSAAIGHTRAIKVISTGTSYEVLVCPGTGGPFIVRETSPGVWQGLSALEERNPISGAVGVADDGSVVALPWAEPGNSYVDVLVRMTGGDYIKVAQLPFVDMGLQYTGVSVSPDGSRVAIGMHGSYGNDDNHYGYGLLWDVAVPASHADIVFPLIGYLNNNNGTISVVLDVGTEELSTSLIGEVVEITGSYDSAAVGFIDTGLNGTPVAVRIVDVLGTDTLVLDHPFMGPQEPVIEYGTITIRPAPLQVTNTTPTLIDQTPILPSSLANNFGQTIALTNSHLLAATMGRNGQPAFRVVPLPP